MSIELRLVATVQTRNYHGYIESFNTIYFLQAREAGDRWKTMEVVKLEDLPLDERMELDDACNRMASSVLKKSAARS